MFGRLILATLGLWIVLTATCAMPQAWAAVEPSDEGAAAAAAGSASGSMEWIDWAVVGGYFALLLGLAVWVRRRG